MQIDFEEQQVYSTACRFAVLQLPKAINFTQLRSTDLVPCAFPALIETDDCLGSRCRLIKPLVQPYSYHDSWPNRVHDRPVISGHLKVHTIETALFRLIWLFVHNPDRFFIFQYTGRDCVSNLLGDSFSTAESGLR